MKFKFATIVVFGLFFVSMTSCEEEKKIAITSDVFGKAVATPSTVRNGDEINLSIGDVAVGEDDSHIKKRLPTADKTIDLQYLNELLKDTMNLY